MKNNIRYNGNINTDNGNINTNNGNINTSIIIF